MKFNWGHGITLFYIIFVGTLATVLIKSFGVDHSLVVDDYYAKDIAYQSQYDKAQNNLNSDQLQMKYNQESGQVEIVFKDQAAASGTIQFYRPSNKSLDFEVDITENTINVPVRHLPVGKWKVKVDWTVADKDYYKEESFYF